MSIRLSKAIRELNIGVQTAVDYLKKKNLGDVEANANTKISDEQYDALVTEFKGDKDLHSQAEKLLQGRNKEKKTEKQEQKPTVEKEVITIARPAFKTIGKIDLSTVGKPAKKKDTDEAKEPEKNVSNATADATAGEGNKETVADSHPQPAAQAQAGTQQHAEDKKADDAADRKTQDEEHADARQTAADTHQPSADQPTAQTAEQQAADAAEGKPSDSQQPTANQQTTVSQQSTDGQQTTASQQPAANQQPTTDARQDADDTKRSAASQTTQGPAIFTLKSEAKLAPKVNVLGKIDLSTINQSTRPKKKSKEERKKEREEKGKQNGAQGGEKKKRLRIGKERVDINAEIKQNSSGGSNGAKKNKPANNAGQQNDGGGKNKNRNRKMPKPLEVNEEDVAKQVKETLARLTNKNQNKKGAKYRKEKRDAVHERMQEELNEEMKGSKVLKLTEFVTANELATMMNVPVTQVIGTCMSIGIMVSINQRLDAETINIVADEFGFKTEYVSAEVAEAISEEADEEEDLLPRAPIVTVMGHVDHGKTSLLDYIRKTHVIAGEAGGITQHIGAYNVQLEDGQHITFLDTPGHEAFTAMRARGAQVTDIAIIIIAADDSVMPTTREAIAHAQAANVPMVFAINKIDKPGANPDKIREDLAQMNLLVEEWGGKYQCQEISAKKGQGVKELLDKVMLEAELLELKANPNRKATGSIIESSLDKGRGYVSTVLVANGTLRQGDIVIAGTSWGRIRAMFNERNQRITEARPAEPATILGLNGAPTAGDSFHVMETEQEAKEITNKREQLQREQGLRTQTRLTLDEIGHRIALGSFKELNLIVKGDVDGSIEALSDSFIKLSTETIKVNVIYKAVGQISESDVSLADASDAIIVGFQVRPSAAARKMAEQEGVDIRTYSVIYDAIDEVKQAMEGMLESIKKEVVTGTVEVREVYHISKVGTVAGAMVTDGKVHRSDKARVIRDGIVVHTGDILALKRFKDDVKEVATNFECGISLVNFNDIQQGDILETFTEVEVKQKL